MKHKHLSELTLREFEKYQELLKEEVQDTFSILELFGFDVDKLDISEMKQAEIEIAGMQLPNNGVKTIYKIAGTRFKAHLNLTTLKASQFIDFQTYVANFKLQEVLSVFLIPQKKNWYGKWYTHKYNDGYDIFEIQEFLYNNFTIGEANELSAFFFTQSSDLLKVMKDYLAKKEMKEKWKLTKIQIKGK
jgi:hypothetical protein